MYSLSSCWNSNRHTDGAAMLREIRDMGFEYAELSHGIRISLLPGILQAVDAGEIKPFVGKTYPLRDVAKVWADARTNHSQGKIVFAVETAASLTGQGRAAGGR